METSAYILSSCQRTQNRTTAEPTGNPPDHMQKVLMLHILWQPLAARDLRPTSAEPKHQQPCTENCHKTWLLLKAASLTGSGGGKVTGCSQDHSLLLPQARHPAQTPAKQDPSPERLQWSLVLAPVSWEFFSLAGEYEREIEVLGFAVANMYIVSSNSLKSFTDMTS